MQKPGQKVLINYRGYLSDGTMFDDVCTKDDAYEVTLGMSMVPPILEKALYEMEVDEERELHLASAEAYGNYKEDAVLKIPVFSIPNGHNLPVGGTIMIHSPDAAYPAPAKVLSIEEGLAYLDLNHPLAGQDIVYWVKLIAVSE